MKYALHKNRHGFTLVEIMIVVAIIALLAAIALPNFVRARKRSQATRVLEDLRILDYALDRWTIENNKSVGDVAVLSDLTPYIKDGSPVAQGVDILGHSFSTTFSVDSTPKVPTQTFDVLSDVAPIAFWSPFY